MDVDGAYISKHAQQAFNELPRPIELGPEFNVWSLVDHDGIVIRSTRYSSEGSMRDISFAWICAKILNPDDRKNNRRFAVGIQWTGDEIEKLDMALEGYCLCLIHTRIHKAVLCFTDLAEEFEEGGMFPEPKVGKPFPPARAKKEQSA